MKYIVSLFLVLSTIACSNTEKPYYLYNNQPLRVYQGGDSLTYNILNISTGGDTLGNYSLTLESASLLTPDNTSLSVLLEKHNVDGNFVSPFVPHYFLQNEEGDIVVQAIANAGQAYWLMDNREDTIGHITYPALAPDPANPLVFTKLLMVCENQTCVNGGEYRFSAEFVKQETVSTSYAKFDAQVYNIDIEITLIDVEDPANAKAVSYSGTQWIYPPLGIVKFLLTTSLSGSSAQIIGDLVNTNIHLSSALKQ